jgi:hypothetical protein
LEEGNVSSDILLQLLPEDGAAIELEVARVALSERLSREIEENQLHKLAFSDARIQVVRESREIRRTMRTTDFDPPHTINEERDIEPWFERYLRQNRTAFYDPSPMSLYTVVENTARVPGPPGRWTRPDICMGCVARYRYAPLPQLDLFSFELKMPSGCNMLSVHEALSHGATAHFAYLCLYLPSGANEEKNLSAMLEQAQRHGVGVIRMLDPRDFGSFTRLLEARRGLPAPGKIDAFVEERIGVANRLALERWLRL